MREAYILVQIGRWNHLSHELLLLAFSCLSGLDLLVSHHHLLLIVTMAAMLLLLIDSSRLCVPGWFLFALWTISRHLFHHVGVNIVWLDDLGPSELRWGTGDTFFARGIALICCSIELVFALNLFNELLVKYLGFLADLIIILQKLLGCSMWWLTFKPLWRNFTECSGCHHEIWLRVTACNTERLSYVLLLWRRIILILHIVDICSRWVLFDEWNLLRHTLLLNRVSI